MDNNKLSTLISEIVNSAENAMTADGVVKAIRDTIAHYPHNPTELIILNALLDRLDEINTNASSVWWRATRINNELKKTAISAEPITDGEEVTADDLPFC